MPQIDSGCVWHVGIALISAVLKKAGHNFDLFEIDNLNDHLKELLKNIRQEQPDIIGISVNSHQFPYARKIAQAIKQNHSTPIFVGGIHTILYPESFEEEKAFDGVCIGEVEEAFLEVINRIEKGEDYFDVKNFWFRKGETIIKNGYRPLIKSLDGLPFPDRSIFRYFKKYGQKQVVPRFIFSRGCPFSCTYCCNHALRKQWTGLGTYLRFLSVDKAIREIKDLKNRYKFKHIKLDDDTFSFNTEWLLRFCNRFAKDFPDTTFECNARPGTIDENTLKILKNSRCNLIKVGVETGNEDLRKKVLNRNISNQDIIDLFDKAKEIGLKTFSFNMVGIPGETKKTIQDTIKLNTRIKPDFMQITIFYPYIGTILGDRCIKEGFISSISADSYMKTSILNLPTISKKEIERAARNFKFDVYKHYDIKKALMVKIEQFQESILSKPLLKSILKTVYNAIFKKNKQ